MLVPVEWLRQYVDFDIAPEALAEKLTMAGLEVEEILETDGQKVFSTYVTPNRPDLLSIVGVARETAALLGTTFKPPAPETSEGEQSASELVEVDIRSPRNCPRYSARVVTETKVTQSPQWMQERLIAAGMRPINNVVDATNYVLFELGQPLHAFDYDLIAEHKIIVRQANQDERITTIDGEQKTLDAEMLVIADPKHAVAIAGVMGGLDSEVSCSTKTVLLESANFNRISIRRTARTTGMNTEASYRFERGVDPELTIRAIDRVAQLIQQTGGGVIAKGIVDAHPIKTEPIRIGFRPDRASRILGFEVAPDQAVDYLTRLGLQVSYGENGIDVVVPTFRPDLQREIDLIEEVGRLYGYERFPETLPTGRTAQGRDSREGAFASRVSEALMEAGLQEIVTSTLCPAPDSGPTIRVRKPLSDDLVCIRNSLILDLLSVISYNASRSTRDMAVFQIGHVFDLDEGTILERHHVAAALTGSMWGPSWNVDRASLEVDFPLCKGIVENLLSSLHIAGVTFRPAAIDGFHPTRGAAVEVEGVQLGVVGEIGAELAGQYDLPQRTYAFEFDLDELMERAGALHRYRSLSRYPAVTRDIAVIVSDSVTYAEVEKTIVEAAGSLLESLSFFDLYAGAPLLPGQKSMAFALTFRSDERTLRDEEADSSLKSVRQLLETRLRASFRDT